MPKKMEYKRAQTCRKQSSGILIGAFHGVVLVRVQDSSSSVNIYFVHCLETACIPSWQHQTRHAGQCVAENRPGCGGGRPVSLTRERGAGRLLADTIRMAQYAGGTSYDKKDTKKMFTANNHKRKTKRKHNTNDTSTKPSAETTVSGPTESCKLGKGIGRHGPSFLPHPARARAPRSTPAPPWQGSPL